MPKMTITFDNTTLSVEGNINPTTLHSIVDALFPTLSSTEETTPTPSVDVPTPEEPTEQVVSTTTRSTTVPLGSIDFADWLEQSPTAQAIEDLSSFVGTDLTRISNLYNLIRRNPQFATRLGRSNYIAACGWLHDHGWLNYLPNSDTLATYYGHAVRVEN